MLPRVRVVPTASGARAVQVIWHYRDNKLVLNHVGSAHTDAELALLKAKAQRLIDDRQPALAIDTDVGVRRRDRSRRPWRSWVNGPGI